jgi:hypothetical protein
MYQISVFPENILAALDALAELGKAIQKPRENQTARPENFVEDTGQTAEEPNSKKRSLPNE